MRTSDWLLVAVAAGAAWLLWGRRRPPGAASPAEAGDADRQGVFSWQPGEPRSWTESVRSYGEAVESAAEAWERVAGIFG